MRQTNCFTLALCFAACVMCVTFLDTTVDAGDWTFDKSLYSNSPKTGKRVLQYQKDKPAYRDPNAMFNSPLGSFPFAPDAGEAYFFPGFLYGGGAAMGGYPYGGYSAGVYNGLEGPYSYDPYSIDWPGPNKN